MQQSKAIGPGAYPRARGRWWLAALVLALILLVAACGGGSGGGEQVATAGGDSGEKAAGSEKKSENDPQKAALEFARCMREHGVDIPDPEVDDQGRMLIRREGGSGGPQEAEPIDEEAHKACRHLLDGVAGPGNGKIDPKEQDRALDFARCMREHGVDMPDPDFSQGGVAFRVGGDGGIDPESPTFKAAHEACKEFFGPPGSSDTEGPVPAGEAS